MAGDLFNLYVWFEVLLIASFMLLALGGERAQLAGSIKYVTLNLIASALFLAGGGHPLRHGRLAQYGRAGGPVIRHGGRRTGDDTAVMF